MKTIFSNFGRRANVDSREGTADSSHKAKLSFGTRDAYHYHASYSSLDSAGGGIGDAPAKAMDRSHSDSNRDSNGHASAGSPWASKFSGSIRGASSRRKGSDSSDADLVHAVIAAPTGRPSHPPSSYKDPSRQLIFTSGTNGAARGLIRKLSVNSRKGSSSTEASEDAATQVLAAPRLKQLPSARDLGSARSGFVSPHQAPRSADAVGFSQPLSPTRHKAMTTGANISAMSPEELGSRLSELAVANADGLLTDDEYRTLRQAVFDRMMQGDKQSIATPTADGLFGHGLPGHVRSPDASTEGALSSTRQSSNDLLAVNAGRSGSSHGHGDQHATSIGSGRSGKSSSFHNVTNMFRKGSASSKGMHPHTSQDSHSSYETANRDATHRVVPTRRDSGGVSSQLSSGDGHSQRASSFRTHQSSAAKSSRVSTFGRLRAGSQARRAQVETAARDMEGAVSAERAARSLRAVSLYDAGCADLSGGTSDRSPTSLRPEMAPSTMFGAEYAEKSPSEIQAEIAVVQAEGNRMLGTYTALEESLLSKQNAFEPLTVSKVIERVRESNPLACVTRLETQRPPPPSSYRTPRQQHDEFVVSRDVAAFEAELASIYTQKAAVVKRYQDRLAFLQSKLRSASIREGLK